MASKLLAAVCIIVIGLIAIACGGIPTDEIQQALQQRLDYYGEVPIVSIEKASNPEYFPSGFDAPPEEVWCVVINASNIPVDPIRMGPNPSHFAIAKRGLQYTPFGVGDAMLQSLFPRMGCRNF